MPARSYFKYGIFILVVFLSISTSFLFFLLEDTPCVSVDKRIVVDHAVKTRELVKKARDTLLHQRHYILSVSEDEINSLLIFVNRAKGRVVGSVVVEPHGVNTSLGITLPRNPFGRYLNLRFGIIPSDEGLVLTRASLGGIHISGPLAIFAGRILLDIALGDKIGTQAVNAVQAVSIIDRQVILQLLPIVDFEGKAARIKKRIKSVRDSVAPLGDPLLVRTYYNRLIELDKEITEAPLSLTAYMAPLLIMARQRGGVAAEENQAALLAIAIFFGNDRVESFVGPVRTAAMESYSSRMRKVLLAGREDLRLHFLISVALKIISDQGATNAVGEFKELMDAGKGSGFSFVDLTADRAGVRFAEEAISRNGGAERVQKFFAREPDEKGFFPDIKGVPEGFHQAKFEHFFQNIESTEYKVFVDKIDQCIDRLPLFQLGQEREACRIEDVVPTEMIPEAL